MSRHLQALAALCMMKDTPVLYQFMTVFCSQDGVLVYGEEACSDLPTVLQSWFCDPLEPLKATDMPR
jgi:hypothetical protein